MATTEVIARFRECGSYPFRVALGGWETGPPCCSASCFFRLNDASVAPVSNLRRSPPGVGSLSRAPELLCAGTRNRRIRFLGPRECSPAAFLDECVPVPRWGLV